MPPTPSKFAGAWLNGIAESLNSAGANALAIIARGVEVIGEDGLEKLLAEFPVVVSTSLASGGAVALLLPEDLASQFADFAGAEGSTGPSVDDARLEFLKDMAAGLHTGGANAVIEMSGQPIDLEPSDAAVRASSEAADVASSFGKMKAARFECRDRAGLDSSGALVFSAQLDSISSGPLVSDDEMKDILSGFGQIAGADDRAPRATHDNLDVILDIELTATARLGCIEMSISEILNLSPGSIIEVGQFVDEPIELLVNNRLVARGDVVVVDEKFGLRITEIISQKERIESFR